MIPENLETGESVIQSSFNSYDFEPAYIIAYSGDAIGQTQINQNGASYNGIFSSIKYILCNSGGFKDLMSDLMNDQQADYIVTCFTVPILAVKDIYVPDLPQTLLLDTNINQNAIDYSVASRPSSLDGYIPRNKKLLQYPFTYLGFNKPNSTSKIYRFEDFTGGNAVFSGISEINPNPQVALIPKNYKGLSQNLEEVAFIGGYPTVSYKTDVFNSWIAQNSNILNITAEKTKFNYIYNQGQVATGAVGDTTGALASLLNPLSWGQVGTNVASLMNRPLQSYGLMANYEYDIQMMNAQVEAKELLPDSVTLGSSNGTLIGYQKQSLQLFSTYSIKSQFAQRIDKYFDMYGYQTNTVKIPNLNNRPNWNYVKTIGANIEAFIPQNDLSEIVSLFDNGITLWHDSSKFLDYSQNNR